MYLSIQKDYNINYKISQKTRKGKKKQEKEDIMPVTQKTLFGNV